MKRKAGVHNKQAENIPGVPPIR